MKNSNTSLIITIVLVAAVLLLALTNPKKDEHISEVKSLLSKSMNNKMDELKSDNTWEVLGSTLGLALGEKMIETVVSTAISVDNYIVYNYDDIIK